MKKKIVGIIICILMILPIGTTVTIADHKSSLNEAMNIGLGVTALSKNSGDAAGASSINSVLGREEGRDDALSPSISFVPANPKNRDIDMGWIVAWGDNYYGQCDVPLPNAGFIAVAAGGVHSLGLKADSSIVAWGENGYGQCTVPSPNSGFTAVAAGYYHSIGLKGNGSIVAWGRNDYGQCNVPSPNTGFVAVSAGHRHSLGLKADGSIRAWGYNGYYQCNVPSPNTDFTAIAAGQYHSLGLKADGSIVAWGDNSHGQCNVPSPNTDFIAIAASGYHSLGLKNDSSIVAWGDNGDGENNVPSPNTGFIAVAAGGHHSLGLKANGSIVAWGYNNHGQCNVPSPNTDFVAIAAGNYHTLAIKQNEPPYPPSNPNPSNGTTNVSVASDLSWTGGDPNPGDIVTYDVYFGTDSLPTKAMSNQTSMTYDPGLLLLNTSYYWRIIVWDNHSAYTIGPLWMFTSEVFTVPPSICFVPPTPENGTIQPEHSIPVNLSVSDDQTFYSFVDFNHDLCLWMRMDDASSSGEGATVYDLSSYQNNGTVHGNAHQTTTGYYGKGFTFDGSGDYIAIPDSASLDISNSITIAAWVKVANPSQRQVIAAKTAGGDNTWILEVNPADCGSGHISFYLNAGGSASYLCSSTVISANTWYQIVGVYNGSRRMLYINGVLDTSVSDSGTINLNNREVTIGDWSSHDRPLAGCIDEVMIFDCAFGPEEIKALNNAKIYPYFHTFLGLPEGQYAFIGSAVNTAGGKNQTETRYVSIINQPPYPPTNPNPANGSNNVSIYTDLCWLGGDPDPGDVVTYNIYFGTTLPPPLIINNFSSAVYDLGTLTFNTKYFWRIIAVDVSGGSTPGPIWSFETMSNQPPFPPSNPNPVYGAENVSRSSDLTWIGGDPGGDPCTYDVFFGTVNPPPKIVSNTSIPIYDPGLMQAQTTYFWRIVSWDHYGMSSAGPLWSFTTNINQPPSQPCGPFPDNGSVNILRFIDLSWIGGDPDGDSCTYEVFFGTTTPPPQVKSNQTMTTYDPNLLMSNTTYYWYVVSWDCLGASTSGTLWSFTTGSSITIYVGGSGPGNYSSIQAGITAADTGDIVYVYPKTYLERILIDKALLVLGENQTTTSINGGGIGSVIVISANYACITGFTITGSGPSPSNAGVYVNSKHVTIEGNTIIGNKSRGPGIFLLYSASFTRIAYNTVTECGYWGSIYLMHSNDNSIINNTVINGQMNGVYFDGNSSFNTATGNFISQHGEWGGAFAFTLGGSSNNTISRNTITENWGSIWLMDQSDNNIITANNMVGNWEAGICIDESSGEYICDNILGPDVGICFDIGFSEWPARYWNHTIRNNTINGRQLYYYRNLDAFEVPGDAAQVILINCSQVTIRDMPLTGADGVQLVYCSDITISGNTLFSNKAGQGIFSYYSTDITITDNTITTTYPWFGPIPGYYYAGIKILKSSGNLAVSNNMITRFNYGIIIQISLPLHVALTGNTITNINTDGVLILSTPEAGSKLSKNMIIGCGRYGIYTVCTTITENTLQENKVGLGGSGNFVYHNNFINNTQQPTADNTWFNAVLHQGNHWSNYDEPEEGAYDNNSDGIVDTPYVVGGDKQDSFPLIHPFNLGDMNVDGIVDFGDINPFVLALSNPSSYQETYQILPSLHGDINQDGQLNFGDINPFVALLSSI